MQKLYPLAFFLALPSVGAGCAGGDDDDGAETGFESSGTTGTSFGTAEDGGDPAACADADAPNVIPTPVPMEITADTTLTCDRVWYLTGTTTVRGATLTLQPGTTVFGSAGSALVIEKDARIHAVGRPDAPIVFTSSNPKGQRARANWGGLVLLGRALVNAPNGVGQAEGFSSPPSYGGTDPAHDCGTLQYVRVEFAGFEIVTDNELNGITFYACGTGTVVDHVQSHMGSDDAFEFFGGGFHATHLVATGMGDDAIDIDLGFRGSLQYVFVHQDPTLGDGNHALEWSNSPLDFTASPVTSPWISNLTFIGQGPAGNAAKSIGFTVKEGAEAHIYNAYFTHATGPGGTIQDEQTVAVASAGGVVVQGTYFGTHAGFTHAGDALSWDDATWEAFVLEQDGNADDVDLGLNTTWTMPNVQPAPGSPADGTGVAVPAGTPIAPTTYIGAVDPNATEDWTRAPWINYDPN